MKTLVALLLAGSLATACSSGGSDNPDASSPGPSPDAAADPADAAVLDAPVPDAPVPDAEVVDAEPPDAEPIDADPPDASTAHAIVFTGADATAQFGNLNGGTLFPDACPAGQAVIGFGGSLTAETGFHRQIATLCGKVERFGVAGSYTVHVSPGASLPLRGVLAGTFPWARTCGPDQVISGFVGRSGLLVDQLTFSCVPILVDAQDGTTLSLGSVTVLQPIGGSGGNAFAQTDCPAGEVATVARLRAGDGIDAFGLACSVASVAP
jgi:hypothetical protein